MRGFEETYRNIVDYIVRITYRIWEDRDVEYIRTGAFSNIELIADEVIWAGNDHIGFHTSHRTRIRGRNDGNSKYGSATNKDIDVLVIANCVALENEIFLEHVCYNTSSMLLQLVLMSIALFEIASNRFGISADTKFYPMDMTRNLSSKGRPIARFLGSGPTETFSHH